MKFGTFTNTPKFFFVFPPDMTDSNDTTILIRESGSSQMTEKPEQSDGRVNVTNKRPIKWEDACGNVYSYFENPFRKSAIFILAQVLFERLVFVILIPFFFVDKWVFFLGKINVASFGDFFFR